MATSRTGTWQWQKITRAAKERDGYACAKCGREEADGFALEVDHIIPKYKGGEDSIDNAMTLCRDYCHRAKSNNEDKDRRMRRPKSTIEWL